MSTLHVRLFGRLRVRFGEHHLIDPGPRKARELFCYLLLYRDRSHSREALASLLWGDTTTAQSKKYLRQALWQLQTAICPPDESSTTPVLLLEPAWVQLNPEADLWLDVTVFEQAFALVQEVPGREMDARQARALQAAVDLYRGNLLEGWYQDWCLYEGERLQNAYLTMLDKLIGYCEVRQHYEAGLDYGTRILRYDRARERTHRRMMRLHYLAGDRTAALRQYERCVTALEEELGVGPAKRTLMLYQQIRADRLGDSTHAPAEADTSLEASAAALPEVLGSLRHVHTVLTNAQHQVQRYIRAVELALNGRR